MAIEDVTLQTDRFHVRLWTPADHVVCTRAEGHLTREAVDVAVSTFARVAASTPHAIAVFHDFEKVKGYDSDARLEWVERSKAQIGRISQIWYCTSSTLLVMAVSVANIVLQQKLRATTKRAEFDSALADAIARRP